MTKTFRQADSRWGSHPYPGRGYTLANSGCGPTSIANLVVNNPNYKKYTPEDLRKYMVSQGFATYGKGTLWAGIKRTLDHYGFQTRWPNTMGDLFKALNKGPYHEGILLLTDGKRGGVEWTTSGHFLTYSKYKYENKKHYFYMHDPGPRHNDGWFCYEDHMKGLISNCWCAYLPEEAKKIHEKKLYNGRFPVLPGRGYFKRGDQDLQIEYLQDFLKWALNCSIKSDGVYGYQTEIAVKTFENMVGLTADGQFGKKCLKAAKKFKN